MAIELECGVELGFGRVLEFDGVVLGSSGIGSAFVYHREEKGGLGGIPRSGIVDLTVPPQFSFSLRNLRDNSLKP